MTDDKSHEELKQEGVEENLDIGMLKKIIEAILFSTNRLVSPKEIKGVLEEVSGIHDADIQTALNELIDDYQSDERAFSIVSISDKYQFASKPEFADWIRKYHQIEDKPERLSQPAIETLAIVAYRQPITKVEIEDIRGVSVDYALKKLIDLGLVEIQGRKEILGHPFLYGTSDKFLEIFGLKNLGELPQREELILESVEKSFVKSHVRTPDALSITIENDNVADEINNQNEFEKNIDDTIIDSANQSEEIDENDLIESKDRIDQNRDELNQV